MAQQSDPLDFSERYNTPIPADKQNAFNQWVQGVQQKTGKDPRGDRYDYDVNGYWLSGQGTDARGHGTDEFKKPNHATFSDESRYNGVDGYAGGRWTEGGYQPSVTNLQFRRQPELQRYFDTTEADTKLLPMGVVVAQPPRDVQTPKPTGTNSQYTISDLTGQPPAYRAKPPVPLTPPVAIERGRRLFGS